MGGCGAEAWIPSSRSCRLQPKQAPSQRGHSHRSSVTTEIFLITPGTPTDEEGQQTGPFPHTLPPLTSFAGFLLSTGRC
jgi:hypothetical protein